jgi:hypothetical protein
MKVLSFFLFCLFLSHLEASSISEVPIEFIMKESKDQKWFYEIYGPDAAEFKGRLEFRGIKSKIKENYLSFNLKNYPSMLIKTPPYSLESSFLVNFHKDEFKKLKDLPKSAEELRDYTYNYITDKNYSKGIELAHQTLNSRSGDCTEHAILLTALLRLQKIPARVILGIVILESAKLAYMHAWTEYQDLGDGHFKLLDATRSSSFGHHYIPLYAIENESMSYAKDFLKALNLRLEKIRVL